MATKWREGLQYSLDLTLDVEKIQFDWTDWLAEIGADALDASSTVTVVAGLVVADIVVTTTTVTATFSCDTGGSAPAVDDLLKATCQATTGAGQKQARSIIFKVVDKQ